MPKHIYTPYICMYMCNIPRSLPPPPLRPCETVALKFSPNCCPHPLVKLTSFIQKTLYSVDITTCHNETPGMFVRMTRAPPALGQSQVRHASDINLLTCILYLFNLLPALQKAEIFHNRFLFTYKQACACRKFKT